MVLKPFEHDPTIFNIKNPELYINMKPSDIPPRGHKDRQTFVDQEVKKCTEGIKINGIYLPGSFYYDINYHWIELDTDKGRDYSVAKVRDNNWIIHNDFYQAQLEKKHYCVSGSRQLGKELANYQKLKTLDNFIEIGKVIVGTKLLGRNGKETTVTNVYPQGIKDIYRVTFADGRTVDAGLNHKWLMYSRHNYSKVVTTQDMLGDYTKISKRGDVVYKYYLPQIEPVEYTRKDLFIPPYVLGQLLGNGGLTTGTLTINTIDLETIEYLKTLITTYNIKPDNYDIGKRTICKHWITNKNINNYNYLKSEIIKLGLNVKSGHKFIPIDYKHSDYQQRLDLVAGLLDSDGWIAKDGNAVEYKSKSETLVDDLIEVLRSLGIRCQKGVVKAKGKIQKLPSGKDFISDTDYYRCYIRSNINLFKLSRKANLFKTRKNTLRVPVINIELTGKHEATCITVDNEEHLFLTDDFVPTHNSDTLTSLTMHEVVCYDNTTGMLLFTSSKDQTTFTNKMKIAHDRLVDFLKVPLLDKDFNKDVLRFGFKETNNDDELHARLFLYNTIGGTNTEVGAGSTITFFAFDEIAKGPFRKAFNAVLPAFRGSKGFRNAAFTAFCVCKGSKVYDNSGRLLNIEDLVKENGIIGYSGQGFYKDVISKMYPITQKECVRITTEGNSIIECSLDHPILHSKQSYKKTINGVRKKIISFKEAKDLVIGEQLSFIDSVDIFGSKYIKNARFLGLMLGNGYYGSSRNETRIGTDSESIKEFLIKNYDIRLVKNSCFTTKKGTIYSECRIVNTKKIFSEHGMLGQTKDKKRVPSDIHDWDKESVAEFIGGYYDADGNITNKKHTKIVLTSVVKDLLIEIKYLLLKFGIHSTLYKENRNTQSLGTRNYIYRLYVCKTKDVKLFKDSFYFINTEKQERLNNISLDIKDHKKIETYYYKDGNGVYSNFEFKNLQFNRINKIEFLGLQDVYNITTKDTHTYIVNGIVTHNTGGNTEKSQEAERFFMNPNASEILNVNGTGRFLDGTYRADFKKETSFAEYLRNEGKLIPSNSELETVPCYYSDHEEGNRLLDEKEENLLKAGDTEAYYNEKIYFPRKISDMFLKENSNPFSHLSSELEQLYEYLNTQDFHTQTYKFNTIGEHVEIAPVSQHYDPLSLDLDQPLVIIDKPRDIGRGKLYVAGLDAFNMDKTGTSPSIGSFYIMRKATTDYSDPYQETMVAWYNGRKDIKHFRELIYNTLRYYGADQGAISLLHEAADDSLTQWFMDRRKGFFLEDTYQLAKQIASNTKALTAKGLRPTPRNQSYYLSKILDYLEEEMPDGSKGLWRIKDKLLVKHLLSFDGNLGDKDTLVSFGHAITHLYKEKNYVVKVNSKENKDKEEIIKKIDDYNAFGFKIIMKKQKPRRSII